MLKKHNVCIGLDFKALKQGKEVQLVGFGKFDVCSREARMGRSHKTGEVVETPAGKVPVQESL